MRSDRKLFVALVTLSLLAAIAAALGSSNRRAAADTRRSSLSAAPDGVRGLAEALRATGREVGTWRRSATALASRSWPDTVLLAWLAPTSPLGKSEADHLLAVVESGGQLLISGEQTSALLACIGFAFRELEDSLTITAAGLSLPLTSVLRPDQPGDDSTITPSCREQLLAVDTLLAHDTLLVAIDARFDGGGRLLVVSDDMWFSNRLMRQTDAGVWTLGFLLRQPYRRIVFEEYHHGIGAGGTLWSIAWRWATTSAWGVTLWQLLLVGLLALGAAAVRFGPPIPRPLPSRRSTLEHVDALAEVLRAARGHQLATRLIVSGLGRRLAIAGRPETSTVLSRLDSSAVTVRGRAAVARLKELVARSEGEAGVLSAATACDTLWKELHR